MTTDHKMESGNRSASSLVDGVIDPATVASFMATSFYLPVDILKAPGWLVFPIQIVSGEDFTQKFSWMSNLHCLEERELLEKAHWVGVSNRKNVKSGERFVVAKIWYGRSTR